MPPCALATAAAMLSTSSSRLMSAATAIAVPPAALISAAHASASARLRETTATFAPVRANTWAMPLPIPLLAPVTTTERPASDVSMMKTPIFLFGCW